ncbi:MAG: hypothetical protein ACYTG2_16690 [Planctomycetota bacterium]|jgi:hypothetical protein
MSPLAQKEPGPGRRVGALLLALAVAGMAAISLVEVLRDRVPLAVLMPDGLPWLIGGLAASAAACALALLLRVTYLIRAPTRGARMFPWRVAVYVFVAGVVVHVFWLQPYRALVARATLGVCAGVVALLMLLGGRLAAAIPRRVRSAADLLAFGACLTLVGGELVLSALAETSSSPLFAREYESIQAFTDRYRLKPESSTPAFPVNSTGHFDAEFTGKRAGTPLAICIGDSFSTSVVPHAYHFTTIAERALGSCEIYNMGIAGIGLEIYGHLLRTEALPLRPDVVVVNVFIGNDLAEGLGESRSVGWMQSWMDAERLLSVLVPPRWLRIRSDKLADARPTDAATEAGAHVPAGDARGAQAVDRDALLAAFPWLEDPLREVPAFSLDGFTHLEQNRAWAVCVPHEPPAWSRIQELLAQMASLSGDTPFAVMLIPDEFQVEDDVWALATDVPGGESMQRDLPQRVLGGWLAERGIPTLDLLPVLRAVPPLEDGRRHLYHLRDTHFNARGNAVTGRALAEFLAPYLR